MSRPPKLKPSEIARVLDAQHEYRRNSPKVVARELGCSVALVRAIWRRDDSIAWITRLTR